MAVFSVKSGKLSEEEIRENQLIEEDFVWWADHCAQFFVEENRGKHIAVVNQEAFVGDTYEETEEKAKVKYPNRRFIVHSIPSRRGKRI